MSNIKNSPYVITAKKRTDNSTSTLYSCSSYGEAEQALSVAEKNYNDEYVDFKIVKNPWAS